ncbi:MAG TPA: cobalt-precorrin-5B (C(1))-methyltransferase [Pseudonocardiaceae bacterium]
MTRPAGPLRRGWTTGACATAATKAAYTALLSGRFPDPVSITLPRGQTPSFALTRSYVDGLSNSAAITKDAGDDPDVTHGAVITATVTPARLGSGVLFRAGPGVGTVTKPGLPLAVGEPAINPVPRQLIRAVIAELAAAHRVAGDVQVEISVDNGAEIATHTWNPRLGIVGGLSILGTTGVVIPYSCSAWIDSIRRGVDVARSLGHQHVAGCTGSTSEQSVRALHGLPDDALLDMGDFAGALLKYLAGHPVARLTIGGGIGKMSKLANGFLDLHSGRSQVDLAALAALAERAGASPELSTRIQHATTALDALHIAGGAGFALGELVARQARQVAVDVVAPASVAVDIVVIDRAGAIVGRCDPLAPTVIPAEETRR